MITHLLSFLIFLPLLGALGILFLPKKAESKSSLIALVLGIINVSICIYLYLTFDQSIEGYQFLEELPWIELDLGKMGLFSIQYLPGIE